MYVCVCICAIAKEPKRHFRADVKFIISHKCVYVYMYSSLRALLQFCCVSQPHSSNGIWCCNIDDMAVLWSNASSSRTALFLSLSRLERFIFAEETKLIFGPLMKCDSAIDVEL